MTDLRKKIVYPATVGALYAALTMLLSPISYGAVQLRLAEALCVLPFFLPQTAVGLALGCAAANTLSAAGVLDIVFGSLSTLLAGCLTAAAGRIYRRDGGEPSRRARLLGVLAPVLVNGIAVGAVLAGCYTPDAFFSGWLVMGSQVMLGEAGVMLLLGLPLMRLLPRIFKNIRK